MSRANGLDAEIDERETGERNMRRKRERERERESER